MSIDNISTKNLPVLAKAKLWYSRGAIDTWLADGEHLSQLLSLGLQLSSCQVGYTAIQIDTQLCIGAQSGLPFNSLNYQGSFCEALDSSDLLTIEGDKLEGFRQNPLLVANPQLATIIVLALKNHEKDNIGCLVMASESIVLLSKKQEDSCMIIAKQLALQLDFNHKVEALKKSERQLIQMNEELSVFASVAAHDLRSPLRAMGSFAGLLRRRLKHKMNAEELEYVDHIRSGATRLSAMVEGILNLAQSNYNDYSNFENIDLPTLVAEVADLIDPDQHHIIEFEGDQRRIKSSATAVKQVLMNLISNAVKYHHLPSGKIIVTVNKDKTFYIIRVIDNGPGIAEVDQERIFEAFVTGTEAPRVPGTGLGLALVRSVAKRLNGSISLESSLGQGSTFIVKIPFKIN